MRTVAPPKLSADDPSDTAGWADRCAYWLKAPAEPKRPGRPSRRAHAPLVITGHGMRLQVDNGALVVRGGFTHYPQAQETWRFFRGDPNLPSGIVILEGSGALSFDALDWLAGQGVPRLGQCGSLFRLSGAGLTKSPRGSRLLPRGAAKSTYASILFPPHFLSRQPSASSHTTELSERWGPRVRNSILEDGPALGLALRSDPRTGVTVPVRERAVAFFKTGKEMHRRLNAKKSD